MVPLYLIRDWALFTYLEVDCVSTNKESLGLKNDWLDIDLTGGRQERMWLRVWLDGSLWDFNTFKVTWKIFFNNEIREPFIYYVKIMLAHEKGQKGEDEIKNKSTVCGWSKGTILSSNFLCFYFEAICAVS